MTITYNNLQSDTDTTTLLSYTPSSVSDACLVVLVTSEDVGNDNPITGVDFGGVAMTEGVIAHSVVGTNAQDVAIFYLVSPGASSGNIVVSGSQRQSIIALTLDNVDQSSPIDSTGVRLVSSGTDLSVSSTTTNNNSFAVSGAVGDNSSNILTLTTGTKIISLTPSSASSAVAVSTQASAGAFDHDWSSSDGLNRAASAVTTFNLAGGGVTVTATEILNSFVDASNVNVDYNVSLLVTESFKQFTDSSAVSIESAESVTLSVTESFNKFIDSSSVNTSKQVSLAVTEILKSFEDGSNISIAKDVSVQVTEIMASFTDNSSVRLPANWNNKPVAVTSYTVKTPSTTIWIDKG